MTYFQIKYCTLGILLLAIELSAVPQVAAAKNQERMPRINIVFLDDGVKDLSADANIRRNDWVKWENRLPTFLDKLKLVAEFGRASGEKPIPEASLYALEISSSLPRDRVEGIIAAELQLIYDVTKRPSAVLARSSSGTDQLRIVFQDSRDYPPAHAAKFLRVLAEISPAIADRRIAENFGPFNAPPTIVFDPRLTELCTDISNRQLPKQRWGILEETYLLPHYVLHMLSHLSHAVQLQADTFYICSVPETGMLIARKDAIVVYSGVGSCLPSTDPKYRYQYEPVVQQFVKSYESSGKGGCAQPFAIMASVKSNPTNLAGNLNTYLQDCQVKNLTPVIVMAPGLTISDYGLTLNPNKLDPSVLIAEKRLSEDIRWTKQFSPIVLHNLKEWGYSTRIESFSHGGRMATIGTAEAGQLRNAREPLVTELNVLNARVLRSDVDTLKDRGFVNKICQITTEGDALASPWSAAFRPEKNLQNIHILQVDNPLWERSNVGLRGPADQATRHTILFSLPISTAMKVEADGIKINTTVGNLLAGNIPTTKLERLWNDEAAMAKQFQRVPQASPGLDPGGVLFDKGNIYSLDLTGKVRLLGDKALAALDDSGGMAGTFEEKGKTQQAVGVPMGYGKKNAPSKTTEDLLLFHRDLSGKDTGCLPFALPRFWKPDTQTSTVFGGGWTFEPLMMEGMDNLQAKTVSPSTRKVIVNPLETGNHLSYLCKGGSESGPENKAMAAQSGADDISFMPEGGDFLPDLLSNKDGTFSWVLRHGVTILFDKNGLILGIRGPGSDRVNYVRTEGKISEKKTSDNRSCKIEYVRGELVGAAFPDSITVEYGYKMKRLQEVKNGGQVCRLEYDRDGYLARIERSDGAVDLKHDSQGRLMEVASTLSKISLNYLDSGNTLRITDGEHHAVDWRFGPKRRVVGVTMNDRAVLWTRSSDGRIIQMALGEIKTFKDGYEFRPEVLIGTLP